jgi:adenosylmethionine-8-amino-7-oxononanoate aminotransferase
MTGFGRTGKWFGYEHFGIEPDVMALGKGLGGGYFPVGAAAVSDRVYQTLSEHSGNFGAGFSWSGNPLAAAVVVKTIEYLRSHSLVERCRDMGVYFRQALEALRAHPTVGDIRGAGLMIGLEFVKDQDSKATLDPELAFADRLADEAFSRGLYILASSGCDRGQAGDQMMFGPPFCITREEIDRIVDIFDAALTATEKRIGVGNP